MKHMMTTIAYFSIAAMVADGFAVELITDRNYVFTITHLADHPPVQFPFDTIADSSYKPVDSMTYYDILFSSQFDSVYIDTNVYGVKSSIEAVRIQYDLISSLGVYGRFVIWKDSLRLRAELTRYGFGVPIINSEKGLLDPVYLRAESIPPLLSKSKACINSQEAFLINGQRIGKISNSKKIRLKNKKLNIHF